MIRSCPQLLQLGILRFSLLQDGDIGIGIFPEGEEILISRARSGQVMRKRAGPTQAEMSQRNQREVYDQAGVIENPLKFRGGSLAIF